MVHHHKVLCCRAILSEDACVARPLLGFLQSSFPPGLNLALGFTLEHGELDFERNVTSGFVDPDCLVDSESEFRAGTYFPKFRARKLDVCMKNVLSPAQLSPTFESSLKADKFV